MPHKYNISTHIYRWRAMPARQSKGHVFEINGRGLVSGYLMLLSIISQAVHMHTFVLYRKISSVNGLSCFARRSSKRREMSKQLC